MTADLNIRRIDTRQENVRGTAEFQALVDEIWQLIRHDAYAATIAKGA